MESAATNAASATPFFGHMCRACMGKERNFHSIRDVGFEALKICEMLQSAAPLLHIRDDDDQLPELICSVCLYKLRIAYHFQVMCIATDKQLRAQLHSGQMKGTTATTPSPANDIEEAAVQTKGRTAAEPSPANNIEQTNVKPDPLLDNEEFILLECLKMEVDEENTDQNQSNLKGVLQAEHSDAGSASKVVPALQNNKRQTDDADWSDNDDRPVKRGHFPCPDCNQIYDRSYRLRCHAGVHSAERPFQCETCKYRFETENQLAMHKVLHNSSAKAANPTETHTKDAPTNFAAVNAKLGTLQKDVQVLQEQVKVLLKKNAQQEINKDSVYTKFPVQTEQDLININKEICSDNRKAYIAAMLDLMKNGSVLKDLKNILSPQITNAFNVNGNHGKKPLKDMRNFYKALLESIEVPPDGKHNTPEEMLRHAIQCQKKRFFKAKAVKNKCLAVTTAGTENE